MQSLTHRPKTRRIDKHSDGTRSGLPNTHSLQRAADSSARVQQLALMQSMSDTAPAQLKGKFIGDPAVWHCHLIGKRGQEHVKMGTNQGTRKDYYPNNAASVRNALEHLEQSGDASQSGYDACHDYLSGLL